MKTYFVTVGQRYAHEKHPLGAHPDGWIEVTATGEWEARTAIHRACGTKWASMNTEAGFTPSLYTRGCLVNITGF